MKNFKSEILLIFYPHVANYPVLFISGKIRSVVPVSYHHLALQDFPKCCFLHTFVLMVAANKTVCHRRTGLLVCEDPMLYIRVSIRVQE